MNRPQRLHIDRLELDLRGISQRTAEAAAQALGPALAQALLPQRAGLGGTQRNDAGLGDTQRSAADLGDTQRIDAGRLSSPASPNPNQLAAGIAQRIASQVQKAKP